MEKNNAQTNSIKKLVENATTQQSDTRLVKPKIENLAAYKFNQAQIALETNIFIPKKCHLIHVLNKVIPDGFCVENIKTHFRSKAKRTLIRSYFKNYSFLNGITDKDIDNIQDIFKGYSIYDVHGGFAGQGNKIYEETTSVVKILFIPDLDVVIEKYPQKTHSIFTTTRDFLELPFGIEPCFDEKLDELWYKETIEYLKDWKRSVGLIVFGYLIYSICDSLEKLKTKEILSWDDLEEEIWVNSQIIYLNRIERVARQKFFVN
jgi:hypothetical protein